MQPRDYQIDISNKAADIIRKHGLVYLAMQVRCGKTVTALLTAEALSQKSVLLEYSEFRHFLPVIERAKEACTNSGHEVADHFEDYLEEIVHGKGAKQDYESVGDTNCG